MLSPESPEKPKSSLEDLGLLTKTEEKTKGSFVALQSIDKRLKTLLDRITAVENSMASLNLHALDEASGDAYQDLESLEDELDKKEKELSEFANEESSNEAKDVDEIKEVEKEVTGNQ
ncbi:uncharacterized protein LOC6738050 [Drosophila simulans]|uniref:GD12612 n=1 Tax=Drosophila simulans TaxID=7240 RepID=B4QK12_DROSI|nr:uncharacterized protein LOC6738050 [Drosophila simulans]EDX10450.1 GD12612 [Drosophila simulans]KMY99601.1 uncharacterized protein Dsimw501_GD12612 [Drosophila simulans]